MAAEAAGENLHQNRHTLINYQLSYHIISCQYQYGTTTSRIFIQRD